MSLITAALGRIAAPERRTMAVACGAHVLHDGFTDLLYVLLPVWQAEFGLGYAAVGLLRALYVGSMAGFQLPAGIIAERLGGPLVLGLGTALAGIGYLAAGASAGFAMLAAALVIGGLGSGVQHPIAANLVSQAFSGGRSRTALARYNFSGDLGKMAFPAATALLLTLMPWRAATSAIGIVGLLAAVAILAVRGLPSARVTAKSAAGKPQIAAAAPSERGFLLLLSIAMIDSATRMGFLTFLPFLLKTKGAGLPTVGIALTLIFAGGAAGKLVCGWLGARLGVVRATFVTEGLTAAGILVLLPLPLICGADRIAADRDGAQRHLVGALRYGARAGAPTKAPARLRHFLHRRRRRRGIGAGALRSCQRPRRRADDDAAGRRRRARDLAARLAARSVLASAGRGGLLTGIQRIKDLWPGRLGILSQTARQQLAALFEHRIGGGGDMGVDALEVAQHVEMQRAGLDALDPPGADAGEMSFGRARFEIAKNLLFAKQTAGGARVVGHEYRGRGVHVADEPFEHRADFRLALDRKGEAALEPLGGDRHQIVLDDVAGMLEVGDKGEDFRQPAIVLVVERIRDRGRSDRF